MPEASAIQPHYVFITAVCLVTLLFIIRIRLMRTAKVRKINIPEERVRVGNGQTIGTRDEQDDYFASVTTSLGTLSVVADGISGLRNGRMSSMMAVNTFVQEFGKLDRQDEIAEYLAETAVKSNRLILQHLNGQGGGTTLAAVVLSEGYMYYGAVGDTLITIFRKGEFIAVNSKHTAETLLEEKVLAGEMTMQEAAASPVRHQLTNYLGYEGFEQMEIADAPYRLYPGDLVLLCSDGIYEALTEIELESILKKHDHPQDMADAMIEKIGAKGLRNQDNATVVILQEMQ